MHIFPSINDLPPRFDRLQSRLRLYLTLSIQERNATAYRPVPFGKRRATENAKN